MGAARMVQQWTAAVNNLLGSQHGHIVKALSCFSFAMCLAGHCHSGKLAASTVGSAKPASKQRRWERLVANGHLDAQQVLAELTAALLANWSGRQLLLVLDETPNGEDLRCLRLGVAYRKRLLSIAAVCYRTDRPPLPMPRLICRLLKQAAQLLPPDVQVTLLCDRGLSWPVVLDCLRSLGWDHVLRLQHTTRIRLDDGRLLSVGQLLDGPDQCWHGRGMIFKKAGWRAAQVTARWVKGSKEPWLLAAREDGPGGLKAAMTYAKRNWCEQSFRDEKSSGFQWNTSHVKEPARAMRLVLVMVLATLLLISLGTWLIKTGQRHDLDPHRMRRLSLFQLGLRWLRHLLMSDGQFMPHYLPYLHPS
jgi:hypothetical protein